MIDKIINEWTYQLEVGYPTKESDYEVLRSVLQETNMLSEQEIHNTVLQAQGIFESKENTIRHNQFLNFLVQYAQLLRKRTLIYLFQVKIYIYCNTMNR